MLRKVSSIKGYAIQATDGELGSVKEAYFDDERWGIRYLVVETGSWLSRRSVLISPFSIQDIDDTDELIHVSLSMDQVKNSPDIDTHQPVSRQLEGEFSDYYGYSNYWSGPYLWGAGGYPVLPLPESASIPPIEDRPDQVAARAADNAEDTRLRSSANVDGYHIGGTDGEIGHVEDFIFDDEAWAIRYFLVDTRNWWPGGRKVLLGTNWIAHIDWTDATVQTTLTRDQIKESPEYDPEAGIDRDYENRLHRHYDRQGYWD
ncbi:PRC-barrel domain-containing protein [Allopusillimonas ginsengisoli]|uniref:PRC-barrel domain-containing protein n=1 Tax=Allopusillimonas ginsengisoli TaxID=453575 RepID=UPI00101EB7BE|nr:PRC-barrel domain-containing protein [Allopusillimonas ginsengisoli]TEA77607.1 PRC-barrel domain containing protein [Allopusillimonas ginsengisoli]